MRARSAASVTAAGRTVLDALAPLPGGSELLELGRAREDAALVGGAVRDLLLGVGPRELDVTVAGDASGFAEELAARLAGGDARTLQTAFHERFGTAAVEWADGRIDIAERRAESYPHPGSLPEVRPGTPAQDLARRDFTVNAMTVPLGGPRLGELEAVEHAFEDLAAGRLRVLHEQSFLDDPTRLLRLARYRARLGFQLEAATARLARSALQAGALQTVSGARVGAELWLGAGEGAQGRALGALGELGVLEALSLPSPFDERLLIEARELMPADGACEVLQMAVLFHPPAGPSEQARRSAAEQTTAFEFIADVRERVLAGAFDSFALACGLQRAERPSQLRALLGGQPVEAIAIAGALGGRRSPQARRRAREWLERLRAVRLEIRGDDLLAAGLAEGPEIGRRLERVLDLKLDGELAPGRDAELRAALEHRA